MLKQWRLALILLAAKSLSVFISACGGSSSSSSTPSSTPSTSATLGTPGAYNCVQGHVTSSGSTALAPLVKAVAQDYQQKCQGASITVNLGGSGTGLAQVASGAVDIGNSDVFAKSNQQGLVDHQVAVVIFSIIANKNVGVKNLSTAQLKGMYSGQITNWNQVGGPDKKIIVVSRPTSSGTRQTFQKYILGGPETISGPQNLTTDSTSTVIQNVAQNNGAIGYAATGPVKKTGGVTIINIDNVAPTADTVKDNSYKFWAIEHMYTKGAAKPGAQALIDYMLSNAGKREAQKLDFVPRSDIQPAAAQAHQQ